MQINFRGGKIYVGDIMLKLFSVKNFRSFGDEIIIDFSNTRDEYGFNEYCIKDGLISKAMIYGKNGVGKSNLGFALFDIVSVLTDGHVSQETMISSLFLNADSKEDKATFHYEFILDRDEVIYEYSKKDIKTLATEELSINGSVIFKYNFDKGEFENNGLNLIGADSLNFELWDNELSILKYIISHSNMNTMPIIKKVANFVRRMIWFRSLQKNQFIGMKPENRNAIEDIIKNNKVDDFAEFLYKVTDQKYKLRGYINDDGKYKIREVHECREIDFYTAASNGTKTLTLFYGWMIHFSKASFIWMDEFDAFYHFELAKSIVEEVLEFENAQVVITSHNTYLLDNELLRPDVYFYLKDGKLRSFADSTFRELREGHDIERLFRNGDFEDE